jgi:hypothetical protein
LLNPAARPSGALINAATSPGYVPASMALQLGPTPATPVYNYKQSSLYIARHGNPPGTLPPCPNGPNYGHYQLILHHFSFLLFFFFKFLSIKIFPIFISLGSRFSLVSTSFNFHQLRSAFTVPM